MSIHTNTSLFQVQFGTDPSFSTFISIRVLPFQPDSFEIKFETTFANAKHPLARQSKGQYFLTKKELQLLRESINSFFVQ